MTQQSNVLGVAMVLLLASASAARATTGQAAAPTGTADRGATVYAAQKCSMCHALDGRGMAKGPLDGVGTKLTADEIRQWIVNPAEMTAKTNATRKPAMRAYPNLPKEDLDALVASLVAKKKTP
jgi:mono/diheme cytochrome c family protein